MFVRWVCRFSSISRRTTWHYRWYCLMKTMHCSIFVNFFVWRFERLSPQGSGLKNQESEETVPLKGKINHVLSHTRLQSNSVSVVPTLCTNSSTANFSQQCRSETNSSQFVGSHNQGSDSLSVTMSVRSSSSALTSLQNHNLVQSSPMASVSKNSDLLCDLSRKSYSQSRTCSALNISRHSIRR
jgi:hypothetical protein